MAVDTTVHILLLVSTVMSCTFGHSWIACTDYAKKNDDVYQAARCRGFPRAAHLRIPKSKKFGQDAGFAIQTEEQRPCQAPRNDTTQYNRQHPMAVYYPGQQVVLAHPMKNHGADAKCTNIYIPDHGSHIYRGERNAKSDLTLSQFKENLVFDLGRSVFGENNTRSSSYPKPGFQNAPAFCDHTRTSMDQALGTYSFNVPKDILPGRYTFLWVWAFNRAEELYSTCFEVDIAQNVQQRNRKLRKNGFRDFSEPCGGVTSNPKIRGNCNRILSRGGKPTSSTPPRRKYPITSVRGQSPQQNKKYPRKNGVGQCMCSCPCRG